MKRFRDLDTTEAKLGTRYRTTLFALGRYLEPIFPEEELETITLILEQDSGNRKAGQSKIEPTIELKDTGKACFLELFFEHWKAIQTTLADLEELLEQPPQTQCRKTFLDTIRAVTCRVKSFMLEKRKRTLIETFEKQVEDFNGLIKFNSHPKTSDQSGRTPSETAIMSLRSTLSARGLGIHQRLLYEVERCISACGRCSEHGVLLHLGSNFAIPVRLLVYDPSKFREDREERKYAVIEGLEYQEAHGLADEGSGNSSNFSPHHQASSIAKLDPELANTSVSWCQNGDSLPSVPQYDPLDSSPCPEVRGMSLEYQFQESDGLGTVNSDPFRTTLRIQSQVCSYKDFTLVSSNKRVRRNHRQQKGVQQKSTFVQLIKSLTRLERYELAQNFAHNLQGINAIGETRWMIPRLEDNTDVVAIELKDKQSTVERWLVCLNLKCYSSSSGTELSSSERIQSFVMWKLMLLLLQLAYRKPIGPINMEKSSGTEQIRWLLDPKNLEEKLGKQYQDAVSLCYKLSSKRMDDDELGEKIEEVLSLIESQRQSFCKLRDVKV